jgi:hypothetical protein
MVEEMPFCRGASNAGYSYLAGGEVNVLASQPTATASVTVGANAIGKPRRKANIPL